MFKLFIMVVTFLEMCGSSTIDKNISEGTVAIFLKFRMLIIH